MANHDSITAIILSDVASDAAGNLSTTSTSTDNRVTFADTTPPAVTVEQKSGQADPVKNGPIRFTATFSEPIDLTTLTNSDITLSGTAGAATAVALVLPELKGKFDGISVRVPTPNVSLVDVVMDVEKETSADEVNRALKDAANEELRGILEFCEEPLVSIDFKRNSNSSIVDSEYTKVINGHLLKVLSWYDNEWGYSCRVRDLIKYIAGKGL